MEFGGGWEGDIAWSTFVSTRFFVYIVIIAQILSIKGNHFYGFSTEGYMGEWGSV